MTGFSLMTFLSTLSLRRATLISMFNGPNGQISIHALLAESDNELVLSLLEQLRHFYPRSPCGERPSSDGSSGQQEEFLSTLSLRRATMFGVKVAPQGSRISIHALLAESDERLSVLVTVQGAFLSTLSLRRATWPGLLARPFFIISIHALLAESDESRSNIVITSQYFYPRSPCGERQPATRRHDKDNMISIHALLAESDLNCSRKGLAIR